VNERSTSQVEPGPILVVDDDTSIREIIAEMLELEGYPVEQAANGAEALRRIEERVPSLILLDMRMPILDGWGVARALSSRGMHLPIVVLTAAQDPKSWAREVSAVAYLAKPFDDSDLFEIVQRHRKRPLDNN
jgi:CheY-like chemotaxis protein